MIKQKEKHSNTNRRMPKGSQRSPKGCRQGPKAPKSPSQKLGSPNPFPHLRPKVAQGIPKGTKRYPQGNPKAPKTMLWATISMDFCSFRRYLNVFLFNLPPLTTATKPPAHQPTLLTLGGVFKAGEGGR